MTAVRVAVAALLGAVFALLGAAPVAAHTVGGVGATNFRTTLSGLSPAAPGITLRVIENGSRLELSNTTGTDVIVRGYADEPYARVGPGGVFVNDNSPARYLNANRFGSVKVPAGVDPENPPTWRKVDNATVYRWHDHRIHWMATTMPPAVAAAPTERHLISEWSVVLDLGDRQLTAEGTLEWVPGPDPGWFFAAAVVAGLLVLGAAFLPRPARWLGAAAAAMVAIDLVHSVGIGVIAAGTVPERLGAVIGSDFTQLLIWIIGGLGAVLLLRGHLRATWLTAVAGMLVGSISGLSDLPTLWRSSAPSALPADLNRATVAVALGLGVGLLVALPVVLRRHATARAANPTANPAAPAGVEVAEEVAPVTAVEPERTSEDPGRGSTDSPEDQPDGERTGEPDRERTREPVGAGAVPGGISRRSAVGLVAAAGVGGLVGAAATVSLRSESAAAPSTGAAVVPLSDLGARIVPFHGARQAGIVTPLRQQAHAVLVAFDLENGVGRDALRTLLRDWTAAAARLTAGLPLGPEHSTAALGLGAASLTVTVGFGPSLFGKAGVAAKDRPDALAPLPAFANDALDPARGDGDLGVIVAADDPNVVFQAVRALQGIARGTAKLRWQQTGFARARGASGDEGATLRNLMGQIDGTNNPKPADPDFDRRVFVGDEGPAWLRGGSYVVIRRIRMLLDDWDALAVDRQEKVIGRRKDTGAPLSGGTEFSPVDLGARGTDGRLAVAPDAHIRLAAAASNAGATVLRRGFSYADGLRDDGTPDAGLLFLAWQADPRKGFIPVQQRLANGDALNRFIRHEASALFAMPPGAVEGRYLGQELLEP
ncbi:iron uptake transporter deferrochelatase/peroxidase subunit [Luedemannella helvata]|uniref:Deferrochelatase n=1 Tax=Luedemannella helvata TaxID=349315 RepID=A0ABP4X0D9_9ACTN